MNDGRVLGLRIFALAPNMIGRPECARLGCILPAALMAHWWRPRRFAQPQLERQPFCQEHGEQFATLNNLTIQDSLAAAA